MKKYYLHIRDAVYSYLIAELCIAALGLRFWEAWISLPAHLATDIFKVRWVAYVTGKKLKPFDSSYE